MSFDQISDMLTRIRNAQGAGKRDVLMQASKLKLAVVQVLNREKYLGDVSIYSEGNKKYLKVQLKYENNKPVINGISRVSRQGQRIYVSKDNIPVVKNGYGIAIISTSRGVMTDKEARQEKVGGEVICKVW
jgi:small subunit ribosomal protein S8